MLSYTIMLGYNCAGFLLHKLVFHSSTRTWNCVDLLLQRGSKDPFGSRYYWSMVSFQIMEDRTRRSSLKKIKFAKFAKVKAIANFSIKPKSILKPSKKYKLMHYWVATSDSCYLVCWLTSQIVKFLLGLGDLGGFSWPSSCLP